VYLSNRFLFAPAAAPAALAEKAAESARGGG
jgi:hypothetical protein